MSTAAAAGTVVSRFAPSPTGYLHVGGARTALFSWLLARHAGGRFLLRIEDTDAARSTEQAATQLLDDLRWLGLHWDNEQLVFQSKRTDVYNRIIDDLIARGLAYEAYDTRAELDAMRKEAERNKRQFVYRRRQTSPEQIAQWKGEGRTPVVRFAMPVKEYRFFDVIAGKDIVLPPDEVQDFIIRKADGLPTFHFAVVVDDAEMGITHVLRGQEHTKNTFLHIALQETLGYPRPTYAHLSVIENADGSGKMGKRDRDKKVREAVNNYIKNTKKPLAEIAAAAGLDVARVTEWLGNSKTQLDPSEHEQLMPVINLNPASLPEILVHDFRKNGYLPEALLNFVALLGWSPGENRELLTTDEMIQLFSLERISNVSARFDRAKLLAFNTQIAERTAMPRLVEVFRAYLAVSPDSTLNAATDGQLAQILAMKRGFRTLREVDETSRFFFVADDSIAYDPKAVEKVLRKDNAAGLAALKEVRGVLAGAPEWRHDALEPLVKQFAESKGLGLGNVAQPIRVAVSGTTVSPPIFDSLQFLGRQRTLARIDRCLAAAS
jgi:glutamyl-tRNA synthetase